MLAQILKTLVKFYFKGFHPDIKENRVQFYEDWNEFVQHKIPKERLLVFNAKQGWGPLCEFLGKPIPEGPYPRAPNVSKTMRKSICFQLYFHQFLFRTSLYCNRSCPISFICCYLWRIRVFNLYWSSEIVILAML